MAKTKAEPVDVRYVLSELEDATATLEALTVAAKALNDQLARTVADLGDIRRALQRAEKVLAEAEGREAG